MRLIGGVKKMESVTKLFVRARESAVRSARGQTMTEYALILAAIAVVVYGTYLRWATTSARSPTASIPLLPTPENLAGGRGSPGIILETGRA